ncbi:MAG: pitrilysin family protein [Desulfuromonadaceae bacterium]|nr:pitrilysin family protein [Desulfuromonadaceae bacterium]MDD2846883.1 pitrilysin family protein [Desulfuromonadaceae bacterium]MDD4129139.1 pitrilysin family protein [Desulfuromonadaceae bacterium]
MINTTTLDNGVRIVTQNIGYMHTVTTGIWVANGTRHEAHEDNGVAHFIEHMLFKGTKCRNAHQITREIDSMGGILNAFTGHEYVCYYAKVLAKFLPRAADLLADIFLNSTFPLDEIERERKVVLQEIKMRDDAPDEYIHDRFHQNFWRGQRLGMPVLGSEETVSGLSRTSILAHKNSRYRPQDIVIAAAGNVQHNELVAIMAPLFSGISSNWQPELFDTTFPSNKEVNLIEREMEQTLVCLGTRSLRYDHQDRYTLFLLTTILGGGMSSRLFQEIREKKGLAYSVYSYIISHADSGALVVYAGTEKNHCLEVIDIAQREMARLVNEEVHQDELDAAREQLKGKTLMSLESSDSLMTRLAKNEIYLQKQQSVEDVLANYDAVSSTDIQRVSRELIRSEYLHLEVMGQVADLGISPGMLAV